VAWTLYGLVVSQFGDVTMQMDDTDKTVKMFLEDYFDFKHSWLGWVAARDASRCGPTCQPARPACENSPYGRCGLLLQVVRAKATQPAKPTLLKRAACFSLPTPCRTCVAPQSHIPSTSSRASRADGASAAQTLGKRRLRSDDGGLASLR
jgi:hypothetical protein